MKTRLSNNVRPRSRRGGFAVLIVLILLGMMVLVVAANMMTVNWLRTQVKIVDQHEIRRLAGSVTNQPLSK